MSERAWLWTEAVGHWALAWTVVVVMVGTWLWLGRPRRAALRYYGWLWATFAGLAIAPLVAGLGPRWSWREALALIRQAPAARPEPPSRFRSWFERMPPRASVLADRPEPERPEPASVPGLQPRVSEEVRALDRPRDVGDSGLAIAVMVWAAGFGLCAARLVRAAVRARTLVVEGDPSVPADLLVALEAARRALGVRRSVRIVVHPHLHAPMCVGLFRPVVLWPTVENCPTTPAQLRASLAHELAHLKYLDDWVVLLAEVWRALSWFYPPVHLLLTRLRHEREYRCDDVASAQSESLESYARWLLDLAPVRVAPPVLASSMLGGVSLAGRVRRLLDGEPHWARPLSRRQMVLLAIGAVVLPAVASSVRLVGLVAHAGAPEPADVPLPDIAPRELVEKIREARKAYDGAGLLEVEFDEERDLNALHEGQERVKHDRVKFPGRFQRASDGRLWRTEFDSMMQTSWPRIMLVPDRWATGFDGSRHYVWNIRDHSITLGESEMAARTLTPRALFWPQSESLLDLLGQPETKISQRTVEGVRCYVVGKTRTAPDGEWRSEYVISPRQGYLVLEVAWFRNGARYVWERLHELSQTRRDLWYPRRITSEMVNVWEDGSTQLVSRRALLVVRFEPGKTIAPEVFQIEVPYDADVRDLALGYTYYNDPWWPEVGKLLRDRFDWPKPELVPLQGLASIDDQTIEGKEAPPIQASLWVHSGPIDWVRLRGKVVLLDFSTLAQPHSQETIPALRRLSDVYKPAGLEVVSVLAPGDDP
ncbi:MAG: hypothetical protein JO244_05560, partial [Solirubrobacterales bacterium]|nr:hypothetical protein [Solirubrobacterales bacterium]